MRRKSPCKGDGKHRDQANGSGEAAATAAAKFLGSAFIHGGFGQVPGDSYRQRKRKRKLFDKLNRVVTNGVRAYVK